MNTKPSQPQTQRPFHAKTPRRWLTALTLAAATAGGLGLSGCYTQEPPVTYSISVPQPNQLQMAVQLSKKYGLGLAGEFDIMGYGSIFLSPETASQNFGFGFRLNTGVFLKNTWVSYSEVTALPTGDAFPSWLGGPVVDVSIPPINTDILDWHFYFGTRSQLYVGVAGLIHAINENFPKVRLEYNFYDPQGRVILGLVFFGPKVGSDGKAEVPGGIFVGTNITPFLPPEVLASLPRDPQQVISSQQLGLPSLSSFELTQLARKAAVQGKVKLNGKSVVSDIKVVGPEAQKYASPQAVLGLIDRFAAASRRR